MKTALLSFGSLAAISVTAVIAGIGCDDKSNTSVTTAMSASATPTDSPIELTLLVTADEDGHILPEEGKGGAAEMMAQWVADEKQCVGAACDAATTIAVSTGDHFAGPAISTYYEGASTAEVMSAMGYRVSALGNHELDFGEAGFAKFVTESGIQHVAANVAPRAGSSLEKNIATNAAVTRKGAKVVFVGLASVDTAKTTMSDRFVGTAISPYEGALGDAVPKAWKDGADAVVVLAHECPDVLEPILAKHPDWHVSLVAGAHCEHDYDKTAGATKLASCGRKFQQYLRAKLTIDRKKPDGAHVTAVSAERISVKSTTPDPKVGTVVEKWKKKLEGELAQEIGVSAKGLAKDSPELQHVVLGAIRKQLGADIALANKQGFRGAISPGRVTKASIYGAIPYENSVLVATIPGDALGKELARDTAVFDGVTGAAKDGFKIDGKPLDPKKEYKVATLDFLYFGGDGFELEKLDPAPVETGMVWQTPVIEFLKKNKTTTESPVEALAKK